MKSKIFCIPLLLAISARMQAQVVRSSISAFYTETDPYSGIASNVFSTASNQAALARVQQFSAGIYGEKRFLLQDLGFYKTAFSMPTGLGNFGLNMDYFGNSAAYTSRIGFGYGRKLSEKADAGIQFNYHMLSTAGYGKVSTLTVEGGMIFQLSNRLRSGFHVFDPQGAKIGKDERLPAVYSAGLGYDASDNMSIDAVLQKTDNQPVDLFATVLYRFDERLFARAGLSASTSIFLMGARVVVNDFRIDVSASMHPNLGITPGLMLIYYPAAKS